MSKCLAIDRNNNGCRCNALNDTRFCKNHSYMSDYTDDMIANQTICSGCKNRITCRRVQKLVQIAKSVGNSPR